MNFYWIGQIGEKAGVQVRNRYSSAANRDIAHYTGLQSPTGIDHVLRLDYFIEIAAA